MNQPRRSAAIYYKEWLRKDFRKMISAIQILFDSSRGFVADRNQKRLLRIINGFSSRQKQGMWKCGPEIPWDYCGLWDSGELSTEVFLWQRLICNVIYSKEVGSVNNDKDNRPLYTDPHHLFFAKTMFSMTFGMLLVACIYEYSGLFNVHDVPMPISPEVATESTEGRKKRAFFKPFFS